ncbi:MAG: 4'-phosphopantetheinyl transferase superfamily protein [Bacteroidetes bacterium]|nr:MAG: 4'-phosphopantetheinyl transferase superfamily protein [Bacteroidota bacterium]
MLQIKTPHNNLLLFFQINQRRIEQLLKSAELSAKEQNFFRQISSEQRKKEFLSVRAVLNEYFGKKTELLYNTYGAPVLSSNKEFYISISHKKDLAGIMLSRNNCGMDIEMVENGLAKKVMSKFMCEKDREVVSDKIPLSGAWSIKESVYKHHQKGLLDFKRDISFAAVEKDKALVKNKKSGKLLSVRYFIIEEYFVSFIE